MIKNISKNICKNISKNEEIINETYKYLYKNYKHFFKNSMRPYGPNFQKNEFKKKLNDSDIIKRISIKNSNELVNLIINFNNKVLDPNRYDQRQYEKCKKYGFYIGLYPNYTFIDEIIGLSSKRKKFSKNDRRNVWEFYFGNIIVSSNCPCCNKNIVRIDDFEMGHKISLRNGGSNNISNLIPLCSFCNKNMSSTNYDIFIKEMIS